MYPKGSRDISQRTSRPRKRKFHGNQHSKNESDNLDTSISANKLNTASNDNIIVNPLHCYRIIEFLTVFGALAEIVICKVCRQNVKFEECGHRGLGFKIVVSCNCGHREIRSGPLINSGYEINRRIIFTMRLLGIGREGINIFCGLMDICQGISLSTYHSIIEHIHAAASLMFKITTKKAVNEEKELNVQQGRPLTDLKVSGDGSWKKRGFTSLYGVATLIGYYSGKVVDLVVKSSYCHACVLWNKKKDTDAYVEWYEQHEETCSANHEGSAGKMEVDAINEMFSSSEEKFGVRYVDYIGDGDSKTYKSILTLNPYGEDCPVKKSECVGHVQKRMGTRLRNIKKKEKLGGKGRLSDLVIKKLTTYYGLAIRRNIHSVGDMKKSIMATLYHYCSTDEKPKHENCPASADSWCEWRKAEAAGQLINYKHPAPVIKPDIEKHLTSIYEDLSNEDLLTRCLGGHTQNSNESFNSTVWRIAPKHLNSGFKIIEIAAHLATGIFNEGYTAILLTMQLLEINIGQQCKMFADIYDAQRISRGDRRRSSTTKEARTARRLEQMQQNEFYEEAEGLQYGPGIAD